MHPFIARRLGCAFAALLVLTACSREFANSPAAAPGPPNRTAPPVNVVTLVKIIEETIIQKNTSEYDVPTDAHIADFLEAVDSVLANKVAYADALLDKYAYDVYATRSSVTGDPLVVFRERAPGGQDVERGWGTYIFNRSPTARLADIHVNHPLFDQHTPEIGADLFQDCRCRWLFVAGAHRDANPNEVADMARTTQSIFHRMYVHVSADKVRTVSVHGFVAKDHALPMGVDQVLSVGGKQENDDTQTYDQAYTNLLAQLTQADFDAGLYNETDGYEELGATINPQGHHANINGFGRWLSVETELNVRENPARWGDMNDVLRQWIIASPL